MMLEEFFFIVFLQLLHLAPALTLMATVVSISSSDSRGITSNEEITDFGLISSIDAIASRVLSKPLIPGEIAELTNFLIERGADDITAICILSAPEGVKVLEDAFAKTLNEILNSLFWSDSGDDTL